MSRDFNEFNENQVNAPKKSIFKIKSPKQVKKALFLLGIVTTTSFVSFQVGEARGKYQVNSRLVTQVKGNKSFFTELDDNGYIDHTGYFLDYKESMLFKNSDTKTLEKALLGGTMSKEKLNETGVKVEEKYKINLGNKNLMEKLIDFSKPFKKEF